MEYVAIVHCAYNVLYICRVVVLRDQIRETRTRRAAKKRLELEASRAKKEA